MDRLTERTQDGMLVKEDYGEEVLKTLYQCYGAKPMPHYANCEEGYCAMEKLADYEDLEEQGKLLKLPCAVGDTVYHADNEYYFTVLPVKVDEISIMESNAIFYKCLMFDGNGDVETQFDFDKEDFGKTVFLTKEAAKAALK